MLSSVVAATKEPGGGLPAGGYNGAILSLWLAYQGGRGWSTEVLSHVEPIQQCYVLKNR